jgi:hypothetical protein
MCKLCSRLCWRCRGLDPLWCWMHSVIVRVAYFESDTIYEPLRRSIYFLVRGGIVDSLIYLSWNTYLMHVWWGVHSWIDQTGSNVLESFPLVKWEWHSRIKSFCYKLRTRESQCMCCSHIGSHESQSYQWRPHRVENKKQQQRFARDWSYKLWAMLVLNRY